MNDNIINNWISLAEYDLQTSKAMLESSRYLYVAFTAQQSIEKILKAYYVKIKNETPPYIHNLLRLINITDLDNNLNIDQNNFIKQLNSYYIVARYSEDINKLSKLTDKNKAEYFYNHSLEFYEWIKNKILLL